MYHEPEGMHGLGENSHGGRVREHNMPSGGNREGAMLHGQPTGRDGEADRGHGGQRSRHGTASGWYGPEAPVYR